MLIRYREQKSWFAILYYNTLSATRNNSLEDPSAVGQDLTLKSNTRNITIFLWSVVVLNIILR